MDISEFNLTLNTILIASCFILFASLYSLPTPLLKKDKTALNCFRACAVFWFFAYMFGSMQLVTPATEHARFLVILIANILFIFSYFLLHVAICCRNVYRSVLMRPAGAIMLLIVVCLIVERFADNFVLRNTLISLTQSLVLGYTVWVGIAKSKRSHAGQRLLIVSLVGVFISVSALYLMVIHTSESVFQFSYRFMIIVLVNSILLAAGVWAASLYDLVHLNYKASVTDPLTGLANLRLGLDKFEQILESVKRSNAVDKDTVSLLYLDLDDFKIVNDELGHDAGDTVLKAVSKRIQGTIRKSDIACRVGGDEFFIVLTNVKSRDDITLTCE